MEIQTIVAYATLVHIVAGGVFCVVLRPLYKSIDGLEKVMQGMREDLKLSDERRQKLEVYLAEVASSTRSAHHRLDDHINKGV